MSTGTILIFAMGVFALMIIGIVLTMLEFNRISEEPSQRKDTADGRRADTPQVAQPARASGDRPNIRVVH